MYTIICKNCGKEIQTYYKEQMFCNNQCRADFTKKEVVERWLNGEKFGSGKNFKLPLAIREYVYDRAHYKCQNCGFEGYNKKTGKTILQIHHIDGDSSNCSENNLQALCPNCHAMTENYMGLNRGKSARKERYKKD